MDDITIPPEAVEAAAKNAYEAWLALPTTIDTWPWGELPECEKADWFSVARAAIRAMLKAWPGIKMEPETVDDHNAIHWCAAIILPLPAAEDNPNE